MNSLDVALRLIRRVSPVAFSFVSLASHGSIPWDTPDGSCPDYSWANGSTEFGLFGSPEFRNNAFVFAPEVFEAKTTPPGSSAQEFDAIHYDVQASGSNCLRRMALSVNGEYLLPPEGGSVDVMVQLAVVDNDRPDEHRAPRQLHISASQTGHHFWAITLPLIDSGLSNPCPSNLSITASCQLSITALGGGAGWISATGATSEVSIHGTCSADWNGSGSVDSQDFFDFMSDFFAQNADFNQSGETDSQDLFDFLTAFFVGCA